MTSTALAIDPDIDPRQRKALVEGQHDFTSITATIAGVSERRKPPLATSPSRPS